MSIRSAIREALPDGVRLFGRFVQNQKYVPNILFPKTFNEKVLAKMLFDRNRLLPMIADKIRVRDYVSSLAGVECLPKLLAVWATADEISINPSWRRAVLKANHGSGFLKMIPDTSIIDIASLHKLASIWLNINYGVLSSEWCYKSITPTVYAEEWIGGDNVDALIDFKIYCFSGIPRFIKIIAGMKGHTRSSYCDLDFKGLELYDGQERLSQHELNRPGNFDEMLDLARLLSSGLDFLRVDLYNIHGKIYFGELTNYPHGAQMPFQPYHMDVHLGSFWDRSAMSYLPLASLSLRSRSNLFQNIP